MITESKLKHTNLFPWLCIYYMGALPNKIKHSEYRKKTQRAKTMLNWSMAKYLITQNMLGMSERTGLNRTSAVSQLPLQAVKTHLKWKPHPSLAIYSHVRPRYAYGNYYYPLVECFHYKTWGVRNLKVLFP